MGMALWQPLIEAVTVLFGEYSSYDLAKLKYTSDPYLLDFTVIFMFFPGKFYGLGLILIEILGYTPIFNQSFPQLTVPPHI